MSSASALVAPSPLARAREHHARGELLAAADGYRETLEAQPASRDALLGLSLIARQTNQPLAALRMAEAALTATPACEASGANWALAWANYGDCLFPYDRESAEAAFRQAIRLDDEIAAAHFGLGNLLALQENFAGALQSFETARRWMPNLPEFAFAAAFALGKLGRHGEAVIAYRRAVELRPGFASAWLNLGVELIADGQDSIAELCYRQALAASTGQNPHRVGTRISAHINLGNLERSRRRFPEARRYYEQALELTPAGHPRLAEVHIAIVYLHLEQEGFALAWRALELAAATRSAKEQCAEIANARGILLLAEDAARPMLPVPPAQSGCDHGDRLRSAIEAFAEAERLGHRTAASNRGNALLRLGQIDEALAAQKGALALDPHHPGVRYNLALTQLRAGLFAQGWRNYEARWQFREVHPHPRRFAQPRWQGDALEPGARLFLYAEQGLGDTLQFLRYLPLVVRRAPNASILLEVQPALVRLLTQCVERLPWLPVDAGVEVIGRGDPLSPFSHLCPLMSLPAVFGTTLATVPPPLSICAESMRHVSPGAKESGSSGHERIPRIGINWAGNPAYRADRERSTHLSTLLPLLQIPQIQWVSLQKGSAAGQIEQIRSSLPESWCFLDACSQDRDLADTAATVEGLDLVITTDTVIAHLAGCMAKPVWLLLPWQADWRWMQAIESTPWYPTARLFRQSSADNWPELMNRITGEVPRFLQTKSGPTDA
jgi:tetratricopeptide (TPR) repeat protein